jgi:4'-phosphopantetheinyl transferase
MNMDIRTDQVDLWLSFLDETQDAKLLDKYRELLTDVERTQEHRFRFSKDRHRYIVTRALTRTVLSRYAPVAPEQWSFKTNAYGKPEIANNDPIARKMSFNISHTDGLVVLAVTGGQPLGVDIENVGLRRVTSDLANGFFAADETRDLYALPSVLQHDRFFQYWTLKESYIKARGMGLSIPLDQFSFDLRHDARINISFDSRLDDFSSHWRFWQFRIFSTYLMAICVEHGENLFQPLNIKRIIPLVAEEPLELSLIRESI